MPNYHALSYLVYITPAAIIALECDDGDYPQLADVAIPYHEGKDIYAATCYLVNKRADQLAIGEMLLLSSYARLLAQRGGESASSRTSAPLPRRRETHRSGAGDSGVRAPAGLPPRALDVSQNPLHRHAGSTLAAWQAVCRTSYIVNALGRRAR
ncbi:MAG: hypothetical protein U0521_28575 [Anaerolineae bacterium]